MLNARFAKRPYGFFVLSYFGIHYIIELSFRGLSLYSLSYSTPSLFSFP